MTNVWPFKVIQNSSAGVFLKQLHSVKPPGIQAPDSSSSGSPIHSTDKWFWNFQPQSQELLLGFSPPNEDLPRPTSQRHYSSERFSADNERTSPSDPRYRICLKLRTGVERWRPSKEPKSGRSKCNVASPWKSVAGCLGRRLCPSRTLEVCGKTWQRKRDFWQPRWKYGHRFSPRLRTRIRHRSSFARETLSPVARVQSAWHDRTPWTIDINY